MEIQATISRVAGDLDLAYQVAIKNRKKIGFTLSPPVVVGIFVVVILLTIVGMINRPGTTEDYSVLIWLSVSLGLYIFWHFFWQKALGKRVLKKNPKLGLEERLLFNESGITAITANTEIRSNWQTFTKAIVTPDIILLYPNDMMFYCYPKRCFTAEQYSDLQMLVRKNVKAVKEA